MEEKVLNIGKGVEPTVVCICLFWQQQLINWKTLQTDSNSSFLKNLNFKVAFNQLNFSLFFVKEGIKVQN